MTEPAFSFSRQFQPPGMAGLTSAPQNVEEQDVPPGAPAYASGPLANMPPRPSPTPQPNSLTTLANGGTNHQQAWMAGQATPVSLPQQQPFSASAEQDLPPGAPGYAGGPLANMPPRPAPTPVPRAINPKDIAHFSFGSAFDQAPQY